MKIVTAKCVASLVGVAGVLVGAVRLHACGPWLPEQILVSRQVVLRTPVGDFAQEVMALTKEDGAPELPPGLLRALPSPVAENRYNETPREEVAAKAEASELGHALEYYRVPAEQRDNLVVAYKAFRDELRRSTTAVRKPKGDDGDNAFRFDEHAQAVRQAVGSAPKPPPAVLPPALAEGLPGEWADYLQGAYCFWRDDLDGARAAWERVLARPQAQRLYCSTQAAYMLARITDEPGAPPEDNARRYQRVRQLRAEGCRDLFNLASESLGWEGRVAYVRHDHATAARLYYLQAVSSGSSGDFDVISSSLRAVAQDALGQAETSPEAMAATARDPFLRRVITLYLACHRAYSDPEPPPAPGAVPSDSGKAAPDPAATERQWLSVLTNAGVNVVREAAPVAWTAYQQADYEQAAAWLAKAPAADGLALWLRAKLALRAGKADEAAGFFARAVRCFPVEIKDVENNIDNATQLALDGAAFRPRQFQADLGIVNLSRHDYGQALSALLRSGFWRDAAYVAERVLTLDELRAYVQANFPQVPAPSASPPSPVAGQEAAGTPTPTQDIQSSLSTDHSANPAAYSLRYLLARRLSRDSRYAEAREYYPAPLWPKFDEYVAARKLGDSARQGKDQRADALWRAAKIERWLGMEISGSEDDPDWFVEEGQLDDDHYREARLARKPPGNADDSNDFPTPTPAPPYVPPVSADEKRRVEKDQVHPEKRYHYRYLAADLAWKAASLMADQQEQTARVLAAGGLWLMSVHEDQAADKFYLAILRRCGQTAVGREAAKTGGIPAVPHEEP